MTRAPLSYFTQDGFDAFQEMSTVQDDVFCMLRMDETGAFPVRVYTCRRLIDLSNDCRYTLGEKEQVYPDAMGVRAPD